MFPHWRYVLDRLIAPVQSVYAHSATHIPVRYDESALRYDATADDAAYAILELEGGVVAQINSSWAVRVNREELVELQVDGTEGSAVAGLRACRAQHRTSTPKPVWDPDVPATEQFRSQWVEVPDNVEWGNAFRVEWELFLEHITLSPEFPYDLYEGAKDVQLAELALLSAREGRRVAVPELGVSS